MSYDFLHYQISRANNTYPEAEYNAATPYNTDWRHHRAEINNYTGYENTNYYGMEYESHINSAPAPSNLITTVYKKIPIKKRKYTSSTPPFESTALRTATKIPIFDGRDASYPDELNKLILPLHCCLCNTAMNSVLSAKDHYKSKSHDRMISAWLTENYTEKGLEPPEIKRFVTKASTSTEIYHCKICDLKLTSLTHANQHYAGRRHRLVANNISKPSGAGYFNPKGEWVRTGSKAQPALSKMDGRYGENFKANVAQPLSVGDPSKMQYCNICNLYTTSDNQMTMHLAGAKHRKKVTAQVLESAMSINTIATGPVTCINIDPHANDGAVNCNPVTFENNIQSPNKVDDVAAYRTPSGSYYCKKCDVTVPSALTLQQHFTGKKHNRKGVEEGADKKVSPSS